VISFHLGGRVERKTPQKNLNTAEPASNWLAVFFLLEALMGHKDVSTTMIYTHVLNKGGKGVSSPLDGL
jgi:integrase